MIQRRKFGNDYYDLLDETKSLEEIKQKQKKFWKTWMTHYKITKSTHPEDPLPYKLWGYNDSEMVWNRIKSEILPEVDIEIRKLIIDLNTNKVYTVESCSGHGTEPGKLWLVKNTFDQAKFMNIMKKHGMSNIRRGSQPRDGGWRDHLFFTFDLPGHIKYPVVKKRKIVKRKQQNTYGSIVKSIFGVS